MVKTASSLAGTMSLLRICNVGYVGLREKKCVV